MQPQPESEGDRPRQRSSGYDVKFATIASVGAKAPAGDLRIRNRKSADRPVRSGTSPGKRRFDRQRSVDGLPSGPPAGAARAGAAVALLAKVFPSRQGGDDRLGLRSPMPSPPSLSALVASGAGSRCRTSSFISRGAVHLGERAAHHIPFLIPNVLELQGADFCPGKTTPNRTSESFRRLFI
jgi:hypothetical protein